MPPSRCGLDHDIINVDFYQFADEIMKNVIHGTLICCTGIFQSKGHNQVFEQANRAWYPERGLVYILWGHKNLVVAGITIHKTHHLMTSRCVDQCFRNRHRILIFWRCSVEVSEIHANSPSAIFLLDRDHARDPLSIPTWPDESCIQHLFHFFLNLLQDFGLHLPCWLLKRPKSLLERESMLDDASIQTGHLSIIPRKTVLVLLQQCYHLFTQDRV